MNKVLDNQIKKTLGNLSSAPQSVKELLKLVAKTYDASDDDRRLTERAFELSSKELSDLNTRLQTETVGMKNNLQELEHLNKLMVNRELKMIELKAEISRLKAQLTAQAPTAK